MKKMGFGMSASFWCIHGYHRHALGTRISQNFLNLRGIFSPVALSHSSLRLTPKTTRRTAKIVSIQLSISMLPPCCESVVQQTVATFPQQHETFAIDSLLQTNAQIFIATE